MAKRRRKMTLFDVMHTGQSVGLQVRTRTPTYQPTPELPVTKKLAKLFGRTPRPVDANKPRSAADELEQLRRELGAKTAAESPTVTPDLEDDVAAAPVVSSFSREPIVEVVTRREPVREEPREPRAPRRSMRDVLREKWALASPKLEVLRVHLTSFGERGANHTARGLGFAREMYSRYAVTTAAALGVVVLLCGSFYAGKLLFNRPAAVGLSNSTVANGEVRPDVLDLDNKATHTGEAIANINSQPETKLERTAELANAPKSTVFGGRRQDLNYVIVQSYRTQAEAVATTDVLGKYGVQTTVEINLPRWASSGTTLYSVVSLDGFQKLTGNDVYKAYIAKIAQISDQEAGKTLPKRLEPGVYKWAAATP